MILLEYYYGNSPPPQVACEEIARQCQNMDDSDLEAFRDLVSALKPSHDVRSSLAVDLG
jgi:hypothetical protein